MATAKPIKEEKKEGNIENLAALSKEFISGKMDPKKVVALKNKLVSLWTAKSLTEAESGLLESILGREFKRAQIDEKHLEILNRIEEARCTEKCRCKVDDAPMVFYVLKDQVCSFRREEQSNAKKMQAGSLYQYVIFVEKIIPPEFQMTRELLLKEERGHHAAEDMYPKEKKILHRLQLDDMWFEKIFDVEEDFLGETKAKEEVYTF